jgi:hypothetical protein
MIDYNDELRLRIVENLAAHQRTSQALDGLRHAAVAIVIIDSEPNDFEDPHQPSDDPMRGVPGDVSGLDGRMRGVSGGASFYCVAAPPR